jgi:hypothetical protein
VAVIDPHVAIGVRDVCFPCLREQQPSPWPTSSLLATTFERLRRGLQHACSRMAKRKRGLARA